MSKISVHVNFASPVISSANGKCGLIPFSGSTTKNNLLLLLFFRSGNNLTFFFHYSVSNSHLVLCCKRHESADSCKVILQGAGYLAEGFEALHVTAHCGGSFLFTDN